MKHIHTRKSILLEDSFLHCLLLLNENPWRSSGLFLGRGTNCTRQTVQYLRRQTGHKSHSLVHCFNSTLCLQYENCIRRYNGISMNATLRRCRCAVCQKNFIVCCSYCMVKLFWNFISDFRFNTVSLWYFYLNRFPLITEAN